MARRNYQAERPTSPPSVESQNSGGRDGGQSSTSSKRQMSQDLLSQQQCDAQLRSDERQHSGIRFSSNVTNTTSTDFSSAAQNRNNTASPKPILKRRDEKPETSADHMGVQKRLPARQKTVLSGSRSINDDALEQSKLCYDLDDDEDIRLPLGAPAFLNQPRRDFSPRKRRKLNESHGQQTSDDSEKIGQRVKNLSRRSAAKHQTPLQKVGDSSSKTRTSSLDDTTAETSKTNSKASKPAVSQNTQLQEHTKATKEEETARATKRRSNQKSRPRSRGRPPKVPQENDHEEPRKQARRTKARPSNGKRAQAEREDNAEESDDRLFVTQGEKPSDQAGNAGNSTLNAQGPRKPDAKGIKSQPAKQRNVYNDNQQPDADKSRRDHGSQATDTSDNDFGNKEGNGEHREEEGDEDDEYDEDEDDDEKEQSESEEYSEYLDEMTKDNGIDVLDDSRLYGKAPRFKNMLAALKDIGIAKKNRKKINRRKQLSRFRKGPVKDLCLKYEEIIANMPDNSVKDRDTDLNGHNGNGNENLTLDATTFMDTIKSITDSITQFEIPRGRGKNSPTPKDAISGIYAYIFPPMVRILLAGVVAYDKTCGETLRSELWQDNEQCTFLQALITHMQSILALSHKIDETTERIPKWKPDTSLSIVRPMRTVFSDLRPVLTAFQREHAHQHKRRRAAADEAQRRIHREQAAAVAAAAAERARLERALEVAREARRRRGEREQTATAEHARRRHEHARRRHEHAEERLAEVWRTLRACRSLVEPDLAKKLRFAAATDDDDDDEENEEEGDGDPGMVYDEHGEPGERVFMFGARDGGGGSVGGSPRAQRKTGRTMWEPEQTELLVIRLERFEELPPRNKAMFIGPKETHPFQYVFQKCCGYNKLLQDKDALEIVRHAGQFRESEVRFAEENGEELERWIEEIPVIEWRRGL